MRDRTLIVGLGSPHGDDRIGWIVADELDASGDDPAKIRKAASAAEILDWMDGIDRLLICDACRGAGVPGQLFRWRWPDIPVRVLRTAGTHDLGLAKILETAGALGRLPADVEVCGIEIVQSEPGRPLSPELAGALPDLVAKLRDASDA